MSESDTMPTLIAADTRDVHEARRRSRDLTVLWISLAVIALSFALRVRPDQ